MYAPRNGSPPIFHRSSNRARSSSSLASSADSLAGAASSRRTRVGIWRLASRKSRVVGLDLRDLLRVERPVVRRHRVGRGALEHDELVGLLGDDRDRLDRRGAGADHADPLAGEVDALVGPAAGVVRLALERVERRRCRACWRPTGSPVAMTSTGTSTSSTLVGARPASGALSSSKVGGGDRGRRTDVAAQVEAVGDVLGVARGSRAAAA